VPGPVGAVAGWWGAPAGPPEGVDGLAPGHLLRHVDRPGVGGLAGAAPAEGRGGPRVCGRRGRGSVWRFRVGICTISGVGGVCCLSGLGRGQRRVQVPDVLVKVAACGITHNELDWPIWTCRAGHRRLLAPRLRTSPNHSASSGLERGLRAERRLGAQGLGRWMAGRLHFYVPVIPRSSGDRLTPLWKPSQPPKSQLAATLARLK
jgi:hypothetical protein